MLQIDWVAIEASLHSNSGASLMTIVSTFLVEEANMCCWVKRESQELELTPVNRSEVFSDFCFQKTSEFSVSF